MVVSKKGVVAAGEGSVRSLRHVWLCSVIQLGLFLSLPLTGTVNICCCFKLCEKPLTLYRQHGEVFFQESLSDR